ncbi:MAG: hypothetical protein DBY14_01060 [Escherichia coli]|nr:MAG: hypothetical protein DBY14_01060 [Escherichia coli]
MKRIWYAVAFLILTLSLCTYEQIFLNNSCQKVISSSYEIEKEIEKNDFKEAEELCVKAEKNWEKSYDILSMMIDHDILNNEKLGFKVLFDTIKNNDTEESLEALREIRSNAELIVSSCEISLSNIF